MSREQILPTRSILYFLNQQFFFSEKQYIDLYLFLNYISWNHDDVMNLDAQRKKEWSELSKAQKDIYTKTYTIDEKKWRPSIPKDSRSKFYFYDYYFTDIFIYYIYYDTEKVDVVWLDRK